MKSKAPLMLMEELVMLAVFALAAALCLQAFVKSDQMSRAAQDRDRAALLCQSVAEAVQNTGGDLEAAAARLDLPFNAYRDEGVFVSHYREDWTLNTADRTYAFVLHAQPEETDLPGLGRARVWVNDARTGETVFSLTTAWQEEVTAHG